MELSPTRGGYLAWQRPRSKEWTTGGTTPLTTLDLLERNRPRATGATLAVERQGAQDPVTPSDYPGTSQETGLSA